MALDKITLEVPMAQGADTKTDPKRVAPGGMVSIQNVTFQNPGKARKRRGNTKVGSTQTAGNAIETLNGELVMYDGLNVKAYSEQQADFVQKGIHLPITFTATDLIANSYNQSFQDLVVTSAGFSVLVWSDSAGGCHYCVYDTSTKTFLVNDTSLNVSATGAPKVMVLGTNVVIMYWNGTNLVYRVIANATPTTIGSEVTISANGQTFGASVFNSKIYMAYYSSGSSTLRFRTLSSALSLSAESTYVSGETFTDGMSPCVFGDSSNNMFVVYKSYAIGVNHLVYVVRDSSLGSVLTQTEIEAFGANTNPGDVKVSGYFNGTAGQVFYSFLNDDQQKYYPWVSYYTASDYFIKSATITTGGSVSSGVLARGMGVASQPFVQTINGSSFLFLIGIHQSQLQSTYFMIGATGVVYARWAIGTAGPIQSYVAIQTSYQSGGPNGNILPAPQQVTSGEWVFPYTKQRNQEAQSGQIVALNGISLIDFSFAQPVQIEELGNDLYFGGARPSIYDGRTVVEQGFNYSAEFPYVSTQTQVGTGVLAGMAGGGLTPSSTGPSTYSYVAVYEWTDAKGNIHRSDPINAATLKLGSDGYYTQGILSLTSGSATVTSSYSTNNNVPSANRFAVIGTKLSGTNVASGSYAADIGAANWTMSANATGTGTNPVGLNHRFALLSCSGSSGYNQFTFYATRIFSLSIFVTADNQYLLRLPKSASTYDFQVGDGVIIAGYNYTITAVSGSTVTIGSVQEPGSYTAQFYRSSTGTSTSGSTSVTGLTSSFISRCFPNAGSSPAIQVFGANINASHEVTATWASSTSITLSENATGTGSFQLFSGWDPTTLIQKGQTLEAPSGITAGTQVVSTSGSRSRGGYLITSAPLSATLNNDVVFFVGTACARIAVSTLRLTDKTSANSSNSIAPRVVLYRTIANGTVYYQVSDISNPTVNDPTVDYLFIIDTVPDNILTGNNQLYTTGGQLQNDPLPATNKFGRFKNRLFAVPMENAQSAYFSKQVVSGQPAEFSDFLVQNTENTGGDVTAVSQMDDKIVFFKKTAMFYIAGDGPSDNGLNNDFIYPQIISSDVGCVDPKSVVLYPDGLLFKSSKGIYKLNRGMQVSYIGAPVESYNGSTVTSAILVKDQNHVRFSLSSGEVLVYDYYLDQWTVNTGIAVADSTIWNDAVTVLSTAGIVYKESSSVFTDNSAVVPISFKTGWLSFAKVQGFQRVYKLLILGDYKSPHTLTVNVRRDFSDTIVQTVTIPVLSDPGTYQFRVYLQIQKCESVQFEVIETQSPAYGEGFSLSSLAVEVGVKRGTDKIASGASYG